MSNQRTVSPLPGSVTLTNLRSTRTFPSFNECPYESSLNLDYFERLENNLYTPRRHWCLFAELEGSLHFLRRRLTVRDRDGTQFQIVIHTEDGELPDKEARLLCIGNTVAVMYAVQHEFWDMTIGVRQEHETTLKVRVKTWTSSTRAKNNAEFSYQVLPMSLQKLYELNDRVFEHLPTQGGQKKCHNCGKMGSEMKSCARCQVSHYCNKVWHHTYVATQLQCSETANDQFVQDCQTEAWNSKGHNQDCKLLSNVLPFLRKDWDHYSDWSEFPI